MMRTIASPYVVLPIDNIDTDIIIPARFLKVTEKTGPARRGGRGSPHRCAARRDHRPRGTHDHPGRRNERVLPDRTVPALLPPQRPRRAELPPGSGGSDRRLRAASRDGALMAPA